MSTRKVVENSSVGVSVAEVVYLGGCSAGDSSGGELCLHGGGGGNVGGNDSCSGGGNGGGDGTGDSEVYVHVCENSNDS